MRKLRVCLVVFFLIALAGATAAATRAQEPQQPRQDEQKQSEPKQQVPKAEPRKASPSRDRSRFGPDIDTLMESVDRLTAELSRELEFNFEHELPELSFELGEMVSELVENFEFDEDHWHDLANDLEWDAEDWARNFEDRFESEHLDGLLEIEWQAEEMARELESRFDSPEWRLRMNELEGDAERIGRRLEERFDSDKWEEWALEMERHARELSDEVLSRWKTREKRPPRDDR